MEELSISSMCIVGSPTSFPISYMPSLGSFYYAFKYDLVVNLLVDYGIMVVVCIVHIAYVVLNFEVQ
jgi:hypothetical protein